MKETACTLWEKAWGGCGQGLQSSYILPLQGSGAPLHFLSKMEGEGRGRAPSPPPPQAHRHMLSHPSSPKAPPPVGQHHIQGQTTTPQPHHDPPCLLPAAATPRNGGCPRSLPLTRSSLQARGSRQGERRRKGGSEGRGTAKGEKERTKDSHSHHDFSQVELPPCPWSGGTWLLTCCLRRHHRPPPPSQNLPRCRTP